MFNPHQRHTSFVPCSNQVRRNVWRMGSKKGRRISGVTQFELCFLFSYVNTYNFVNHFLITIKICRINLYYFAHSIIKKIYQISI